MTPDRAHPRSRGEHRIALNLATLAAGSSPLARGTRLHAGRLAALWVAHPRSRGEHSLTPVRDMPLLGSSPLARGTLMNMS